MRSPDDGSGAPRIGAGARPGQGGRWRRRALSAGLVAFLALLQAVPSVRLLSAGIAVPLPLAIGATNFICIPLTLSLLDRVLSTRVATLPRTFIGASVGAVVGGLVGLAIWSGVFPNISRSINDAIAPPETAFSSFIIGAVMSVLVVGVWTLVFMFPRILEQERARELELAELRARAELTRLRGQLEPHFLLNTLNLISGLLGMDVDRARRTLANLGALLRDTLEEHGDLQTLGDEVAWLVRYCEILEARHGTMLRVAWGIDDEARDALVPRLVLQPLVENAIVHGALRAGRAGLIRIRAALESDRWLVCSVEDNGQGPIAPPRVGAVGVENVKRRLAITYPNASFALEATIEGTRAVIRMPYVVSEEARA
jgi:signal transduction histidine kinase